MTETIEKYRIRRLDFKNRVFETDVDVSEVQREPENMQPDDVLLKGYFK